MASPQVFMPLMSVMKWGALILGLLSLTSCDYWPPALQGQIEELRAELNDALDDRQRLNQELADLRTVQNSLQQEVEAKARENEAFQQRLAAFTKTPNRHQSAKHETDAIAETASRRSTTYKDVSRPSPILKGSYGSLELTRPHHRGPHVERVQRLLRSHDLPIRVDGIYGRETKAAVRSFQRVHGLPANGVLGPVTYRALLQAEPALKLVQQRWLQRPPLIGREVLQVQRALRRAGHRILVDGNYGPETDMALTRFQRKHGLKPDGIVGPQTWAALKRIR